MEFVQRLASYVGLTALVLLVAGLFKPWMLLWWEDVQNRRKVIKLYGSISVVCFLAYFVFRYLNNS